MRADRHKLYPQLHVRCSRMHFSSAQLTALSGLPDTKLEDPPELVLCRFSMWMST